MRKRTTPDRIASIVRDIRADLDVGLNVNPACPKAGINSGKPPRLFNIRFVRKRRVAGVERGEAPARGPKSWDFAALDPTTR